MSDTPTPRGESLTVRDPGDALRGGLEILASSPPVKGWPQAGMGDMHRQALREGLLLLAERHPDPEVRAKVIHRLELADAEAQRG